MVDNMEALGSPRNVKIDEDLIGAASATSVEEIIDALARRGCSDLTSSIDSAACSDFACAGGGLCDVYKGALDDGTRIAIKTLRIYGDSDRMKILKNAARELYHWSKLQHSNVLPLMGLTIFRGHVSIVSEWMEHGNLMSYLKFTPSANRIKLCMDICEGLWYIHTNGMVHGDLKAANIMVSSKGTALIADFGNAELRDLTLRFTNTSKVNLSVRWAAPELLRERSSQMSKEADVYAFGMTVLEVLTGKLPFQGTPEHQIVCLVAYGGKVPPRPDTGIHDDLWDILNRCWTREPAGRPGITNIKECLQSLFRPPSDAWSIGDTTHQSQGNELNPRRHNGSGNEAFSMHVGDKEEEEEFIRRYMWSRFGDQSSQTDSDDEEEGSEEEEAREGETESSRRKSDNIVSAQEQRHVAFATTVVSLPRFVFPPSSGFPPRSGSESPPRSLKPRRASFTSTGAPSSSPQVHEIHPVLTVPSALRSARSRVRLTWDVRYHVQPSSLEEEASQMFASHPLALEPATSPPRSRMLIICRDLLPWLIPVYARDPAVGCTVLDVVRGIYEALQTKVEVAGHASSAIDETQASHERRRVDWLHDKTVFVCLGRDEALARRRLPGRTSLWEETFVLTLARRRELSTGGD